MGVPDSTLTPAGWGHLLLFGVLVPLVASRSRKRVETIAALPPLKKHLTAVLFQLMAFAAISSYVGRIEWIPLFPAKAPSIRDLLAGGAILCAAVLAMR